MDKKIRRDYRMNPVQTNLELYIQLQGEGYSEKEIKQVHETYLFTFAAVNSYYRGSGKPFICHLVGVAGIMASCRQPVEVIQVALMHALYQNRVTFGAANTMEAKRSLVQAKFGAWIDAHILAYTHYELQGAEKIEVDATMKRVVMLISIADELEDIMSYGLSLHGTVLENEPVKGNAQWRIQNYRNSAEQVKQLTQTYQIPFLTEAVNIWYNFDSYETYQHSLKTGYYSSFVL